MTVRSPTYRLLPLLAAVFVAALLVANTISIKVVAIAGMLLPAGIVVYPLTSVIGDVTTEVYGYATMRRIIWGGFIALAIQSVGYWLARLAPPADFWPYQGAFNQVLSQTPRIAFASLCSYPIGEFVNAYVLAKLKIARAQSPMSMRFIGSTVVGQASDSLVFIAIAFFGTMPVGSLLWLMLTSWAVKVLWEMMALPASTTAARFIKRAEGVDVLDTRTNFNPLML